MRIEQWRSFAVQQPDFRYALRPEARLQHVVILIGKRPEVADAEGNLLRGCFSRPDCFRLRPLCASSPGSVGDPGIENSNLIGENLFRCGIRRIRAGKLQ